MNINQRHWPYLKQYTLLLIGLCFIQIILNFYFPPFAKLGRWSLLVKITTSLAVISFYAMIAMFPESYARQSNLEFFDDFPDPVLVKKLFRVWKIILCAMLSLYFWHIKFYRLPTFWYFILFINFVVSDIILYLMLRRK